MTSRTQPLFVALGLVAVTLGCRQGGGSTNDVVVDATVVTSKDAPASALGDMPAEREVVEIDAMPTMSAAVATRAASCSGHRIGAALMPPRQVSARYVEGVWEVELEGKWQFIPPVLDLPEGSPTREPTRERQSMMTCNMTLDAETGQLISVSVTSVTATPPAP